MAGQHTQVCHQQLTVDRPAAKAWQCTVAVQTGQQQLERNGSPKAGMCQTLGSPCVAAVAMVERQCQDV